MKTFAVATASVILVGLLGWSYGLIRADQAASTTPSSSTTTPLQHPRDDCGCNPTTAAADSKTPANTGKTAPSKVTIPSENAVPDKTITPAEMNDPSKMSAPDQVNTGTENAMSTGTSDGISPAPQPDRDANPQQPGQPPHEVSLPSTPTQTPSAPTKKRSCCGSA